VKESKNKNVDRLRQPVVGSLSLYGNPVRG
jgi:hypothetical protein